MIVSLFFQALYLALLLYTVVLIGRIILDVVQSLSPDWRPTGPILVVAEAIYTMTDPPLRALRRVIKPIDIAGLRLDLAFIVLFIAVSLLMRVTHILAAATQ